MVVGDVMWFLCNSTILPLHTHTTYADTDIHTCTILPEDQVEEIYQDGQEPASSRRISLQVMRV